MVKDLVVSIFTGNLEPYRLDKNKVESGYMNLTSVYGFGLWGYINCIGMYGLQAKASYEQLVANKTTASFKKLYGSCLVNLQDTIRQLKSLHEMMIDELGSDSGSEFDESDLIPHNQIKR